MQDMLKQVQQHMRQYLKAYRHGVATKRKRLDSDRGRRDHLQQEVETAQHEMKRLEKKLKTDQASLRALDRRIRDSDRDHTRMVQTFGQYASQFSKTIGAAEMPTAGNQSI